MRRLLRWSWVHEVIGILLIWAALIWLTPAPPPRCMPEARDPQTLECRR